MTFKNKINQHLNFLGHDQEGPLSQINRFSFILKYVI